MICASAGIHCGGAILFLPVSSWGLGQAEQLCHGAWAMSQWRRQSLELAPSSVWPVELREDRESIVHPSLAIEEHQSASRPSRPGGAGMQRGAAMQKCCSFVEPTREMGSFRAGSYKCLSILAEGVLGKCCMPALSPLRVLPPTPALIVHFPLLVNL